MNVHEPWVIVKHQQAFVSHLFTASTTVFEAMPTTATAPQRFVCPYWLAQAPEAVGSFASPPTHREGCSPRTIYAYASGNISIHLRSTASFDPSHFFFVLSKPVGVRGGYPYKDCTILLCYQAQDGGPQDGWF